MKTTRRVFCAAAAGGALGILVAPASAASATTVNRKLHELQWDPAGVVNGAAMTDVRYHVYRSRPGDVASWERLTEQPISRTSYVDVAGVAGEPYVYAVATVSALDVEGPKSAAIRSDGRRA